MQDRMNVALQRLSGQALSPDIQGFLLMWGNAILKLRHRPHKIRPFLLRNGKLAGASILHTGQTRNHADIDAKIGGYRLRRCSSQPLRQGQIVIMIRSENLEQAQRVRPVIANEIPFGALDMRDCSCTHDRNGSTPVGRKSKEASGAVEADLPDRRIQMPVKVGTASRIDLDQSGRECIRVAECIGLYDT